MFNNSCWCKGVLLHVPRISSPRDSRAATGLPSLDALGWKKVLDAVVHAIFLSLPYSLFLHARGLSGLLVSADWWAKAKIVLTAKVEILPASEVSLIHKGVFLFENIVICPRANGRLVQENHITSQGQPRWCGQPTTGRTKQKPLAFVPEG